MRGNNIISCFKKSPCGFDIHIDGKLHFRVTNVRDNYKKYDFLYKLFKDLWNKNEGARFLALTNVYQKLNSMKENEYDSWLNLPVYPRAKGLSTFEKNEIRKGKKLFMTVEGLIEYNLKHIRD